MTLAMLTSFQAVAIVINNVCYQIEDDEAWVTGCDKDTNEIDIPPYVVYKSKTYKVRIISRGAFSKKEWLRRVSLPNTLTYIGKEAFYRCPRLNDINIPDSVTSIGDDAFLYCTSITNIIIPNSVKRLGRSAFYGCCNLKKVILSESLTDLNQMVFFDCVSLTSVYIPDNVSSIYSNAFGKCKNLESVSIPGSMWNIDWAFPECSGLKAIYLRGKSPTIVENNPGFSDSNYENVTLYVPKEYRYSLYGSWRKFKHIEEFDYSGIEDVALGGGALELSVSHGTLTVGGVDGDEPVFVYDMHGRLVYSGVERTITNLASGLYVVKVGNQTAKCSL